MSTTPPTEPVGESPDEEPQPSGQLSVDALTVPRPSMNTQCTRQKCFAPASGCLMGSSDWSMCEHNTDSLTEVAASVDVGQRPTWSGEAMGTIDAECVTATNRVRLIAIVGLADAGKTTSLVAYFNRLRSGAVIGGCRFAGSKSLLGWFQISRNLEFPPHGGNGFPGHTPAGDGRTPALLHVRLVDSNMKQHDLLFTDVPGEWFETWSADSEARPAVRWIANHADVFVLFSDSKALAGAERGLARNAYKNLAHRVASEALGRPVLAIRAKSDIDVDENMSSQLLELETTLFGAPAEPMSVYACRDGQPELEVLDRLIEAACAPTTLFALKTDNFRDHFFHFRHGGRGTI